MPISAALLSNKPSLAYVDPLGGAYTTAKNNGATPERWNCSHKLVPSVLCFHRDTQSDHESFTNTATPPLCFNAALIEFMSHTGHGLCKHWKPGICNGVSLGNKCVSVNATTFESSNSLCICKLVLNFVFIPPWMFHRETCNVLWS
jgi:hypothetical protein